MLPLLVIFLATQLMFQACQKPAETRTSMAILTAMREMNAKALDQDLIAMKPQLDNVLDSELKDKKIDQDTHDKRLLEGEILTVDSAFTAGQFYKQISREQTAYQSYESVYKKFQDNPLWTTYEVTVPFHKQTWTGAKLYEYAVTTLSANNQHDLIYGVIPGYQVIDFLVHLTGAVPSFSYWFAAFLLAVCVRTIVYPLTQRQLQWGRQMAQLQPLAKEIKEKYKDPSEQQIKTMALYQEYGLNPYAGCLPAVVQLPLFLTVYQFMLHYKFEFQKGSFLWIHPGTPSGIPLGFGYKLALAQNLGLQDQVLILIYGVTMVISTLLTPVNDPSQATQQRLMGVGIAIMFAGFMFVGAYPVASAFVLYCTFTNLLATAQSLRAYRMPLQPLQKVNASTGGVYPKKKPGFMDRLNDMMQEQARKEQELKGGGAAGNGADPKKNGTVIPTTPTSTTTTKTENNGSASKPRTGNPNIRRPKRRK